MNQSALYIADFEPKKIEKYQVIDYEALDIYKLFQQSENDESKRRYLIIHPKKKLIFKQLVRSLKKIVAAGGVVKNGKGAFLFIFRNNKWDMPKGKVDEGEKVKKAAVREVEEECGVRVHYKGKKITTSYHLYTIKEQLVIKKTVWYEMGINGTPKLIPQKEENITKAVWFTGKDFKKVRKNTYPLIKDILRLLS